jgi:hypothetical protein
MDIGNDTELSTPRLERMFLRATGDWVSPRLTVRVRYSRSAIYSGTFASNSPRIYINLGRRNRYPMKIETSIARARTIGHSWWKPVYHIKAENAYQLALFVFLHEFYHYLIHRARRNSHRKESMCDRFAVRYLVDQCRLTVCDAAGRPVPHAVWLFQELDDFVASSTTLVAATRAARRPRTRTSRNSRRSRTGKQP